MNGHVYLCTPLSVVKSFKTTCIKLNFNLRIRVQNRGRREKMELKGVVSVKRYPAGSHQVYIPFRRLTWRKVRVPTQQLVEDFSTCFQVVGGHHLVEDRLSVSCP